MPDLLLELGKRPVARRLIKSLGLPIPVPQTLLRADGPVVSRPLAGAALALQVPATGGLAEPLAAALGQAGAELYVCGGDAALARVRGAADDGGRTPAACDVDGDGTFDALVLDASGCDGPDTLRTVYDFLHPLVRRVERCGRVLVLGRPPGDRASPAGAAAQAALEGFVRSLGKELGKQGTTVQLLAVADGAEGRLAGPLRYFLSPRAAYISGQVLRVDTAAADLPESRPWVEEALEAAGRTDLMARWRHEVRRGRGTDRERARRAATEGGPG